MRHALLIAAAGLLLGVTAAHAQSLSPRTLTRRQDTLVVPGAKLGRMAGAHKEQVRVYACRAGFMIPIAFQVDERNAKGTYCWDRGPRDRHKQDEDRGLIDDNDELVLLARDLGDRARPEQLATVPAYAAVQELEVADPLDGGKAWAYVYRFGAARPGRLLNDIVSLDVTRKDEGGLYVWRGERFEFNNGRSPLNAVRATFAGLSKPGTRDFKGATNIIDSTQVRAVVSFMWITVTRHSSEFKVQIGGYIDGPVRVVAENLLEVYLGLGLWVSAPESYIILWHNKVSMPTNAACPVNLDTSDESSYTLCLDLSKRAKGWKFYNSRNQTPVTIDGRWSQAERQLDLTYPDWNVVYGPEGAMISKFVIPDFLKNRKDSRLIYVDDEYFEREDDDDGIEFEKGAIGLNGYRMDMKGLKKGLYPGDYLVWYAAPPFAPGDERRYLVEYDHPLVVAPAGAGDASK